jgi:hypothetical protein
MVFGMHHQLGGSTEDDMNKMSVIGHISLYIFRFRSYLVTDIGRILDAKGGFVSFLEA